MGGRSKPLRRRVGRPPAGARSGEKVTDYPQLSVRLPPDAVENLHALSVVLKQPHWRVIHHAIDTMISSLSTAEREMVEGLVKRRRRKEPTGR